MSLEQNYKKIKLLNVLSLTLFIILCFIFFYQFFLIYQKNIKDSNDILIEKVFELTLIDEKPTKTGEIYASKKGTKYYYQKCNGLNLISPENLVFFASKIQAEAKGYTLARNCKKGEK